MTPGGVALVSLLTVPTLADSYFMPGNLVVSRSVYEGTAATVTVGQPLPGGGGKTAVADGSYPDIWKNEKPDPSFGVTSPIYLDQLTPSGAWVSTLDVTGTLAGQGVNVATSFPSKSELGLNLSPGGAALTFMGYVAPVNALDVSNSNTPGHVDPTNPVDLSYQRAVVQVDAKTGQLAVTPVNAYSGNNGRNAVLAGGSYFTVGNAGNGSGTQPVNIVNNTGVQMTTPGGSADTTVVGQQQGTPGKGNGFQYGFSVGQIGLAADKSGKDDNFRGETVFHNTLYVTKGSGSNGANTVYQVGAAGTLPTFATAANTTINVLPGFPMNGAKDGKDSAGVVGPVYHPFGIWFANATTLYVADEGDGTAADIGTPNDPAAGLQKWSLIGGVWHLDYILTSGLNLGVQYSVPNGPSGEIYPSALDPAPDGLRNLAGELNGDGTVSLFAITSTVSSATDQGADPNQLVEITDDLSFTTSAQATIESFQLLETARYGEVLRGVAVAVPEARGNALVLAGLSLIGIFGSRLRLARTTLGKVGRPQL